LTSGTANSDDFGGFLLAAAPRMKALAARLTASPEAADDVFQEAALRLWRRLPSLAPGTNLPGYLTRVVVNICMDNHRQKGHDVSLAQQTTVEIPAPDENPSDSSFHELVPHLRIALAALSAKRRDALVLRYFEGLQYADIAALLGCSEPAARSHVSKAKAALKKRLRRLDPFRRLRSSED